MSNGAQNCALEICCAPGSAEAVKALASLIVKDYPQVPELYAEQAAAWILKHFDLAERGTLAPLKASIVKVWQQKDPH